MTELSDTDTAAPTATEAPAATETSPAEPLAFTRARLAEIGAAWADFARERAEGYAQSYLEKLPAPLKHYLQPREAGAAQPEGAEREAA